MNKYAKKEIKRIINKTSLTVLKKTNAQNNKVVAYYKKLVKYFKLKVVQTTNLKEKKLYEYLIKEFEKKIRSR